MAITASDIKFRLSIKTGSAGNSLAQGSPNASLGKYVSTTNWAGGVLNDLFDDITGSENLASAADYRCIFIYNSHATLSLLNAKAWLPAQTSGGAVVTIGVDPAGQKDLGDSAAQAAEIADETVAPSGVTFVAAATLNAGLALGDLGPGKVIAVWIKRAAANTGSFPNDNFTIRVTGETLP